MGSSRRVTRFGGVVWCGWFGNGTAIVHEWEIVWPVQPEPRLGLRWLIGWMWMWMDGERYSEMSLCK